MIFLVFFSIIDTACGLGNIDMNIIYHQVVDPADLPRGFTAEVHLFCIEISDVKTNAENLIKQISNTSWISELDPVGVATFERASNETIEKLLEIFRSANEGNEIAKEFGEYMISLNSGNCLNQRCNHETLPISELWKPRITGNEGFDFHTLGPSNKFSLGEAKYLTQGNAYGRSAKQVCDFIDSGKDKIDSGLLFHFKKPIALDNLIKGRRGFTVAFSINSSEYEQVLRNSLQNESIDRLLKCCDELYIIGVKIV